MTETEDKYTTSLTRINSQLKRTRTLLDQYEEAAKAKNGARCRKLEEAIVIRLDRSGRAIVRLETRLRDGNVTKYDPDVRGTKALYGFLAGRHVDILCAKVTVTVDGARRLAAFLAEDDEVTRARR